MKFDENLWQIGFGNNSTSGARVISSPLHTHHKCIEVKIENHTFCFEWAI